MGGEPGHPRDNIFVVGCQRSGTSAVYAALIAHPELKQLRPYDPETGYDPKELYYFRNIFAARRQFGSPMYGWEVDQAYLQTLIDATVRFCNEHHGAANGRFVAAHPMNGLDIAEIVQTMPEARVVNVLRHPQEVIWSNVHAPWADPDQDVEERTTQLARHWSGFARMAARIEAKEFGDAVLTVRHERILSDPERVAEELMAHVGLDLHPAVLDQLAGPTFNSSFQNGTPPGPLVEKTRRQIADHTDFCRAVSETLRDEMKMLGYEDLAGSAGPGTWISSTWRRLRSGGVA